MARGERLDGHVLIAAAGSRCSPSDIGARLRPSGRGSAFHGPRALVNLTASLCDQGLGRCGEACRASCALRTSRIVTLAQVYERRAEDYTRAAEQTDDRVFRNMLLALALQWRLAAQEEASTQSRNAENS
jgi:hypothetical protein